jgi:hypothetical protein
MLFVTSATLAVALTLQPTASNVSSTPTWQTLPLEQLLPPLAKEGYVDNEGARICTERPVRASQLSYYSLIAERARLLCVTAAIGHGRFAWTCCSVGSWSTSQPPPKDSISWTLLVICCTRSMITVC